MADHAREFVIAVARDLGNRELAEKNAIAVADSIGWDVREGFSASEARYVANRIRLLSRPVDRG